MPINKTIIRNEMQSGLLRCKNIKDIEIMLQEVIEKHYEGSWWNHTQYNIFMELLYCNALLKNILEFIDRLVIDLH